MCLNASPIVADKSRWIRIPQKKTGVVHVCTHPITCQISHVQDPVIAWHEPICLVRDVIEYLLTM